MSLHEARTSLDDINRLQDHTRDEYVRYSFSRCHVLASAAVLFIAYASLDLPEPWDMAGVLLTVVMGAGMLVLYQCGARVRRTPGRREVAFYAATAVALITLYWAFLWVAHRLGVPAPHTVAAIGLALASIVSASVTRPVFRAIVRDDGGHR